MQVAHIENGAVAHQATNPRAFMNISFPPGASAADYRAAGFYVVEQVDPGPAGPWQVQAGTVDTVDAETRTVTRTVQYEDRSVDDMRSIKRREIDRAAQAALERGVGFNGVRWTATDSGRDTLVEIEEVAQEDQEPQLVLDATGAAHTLSLADLSGLRAAGRDYRKQVRLNRLALHNAVQRASTAEDVAGVDTAAGWPQ